MKERVKEKLKIIAKRNTKIQQGVQATTVRRVSRRATYPHRRRNTHVPGTSK